MDEDKRVTKLPEPVKTALEQFVGVWADEFLGGLPALLQYAFFINMEKAIVAETNRILKTFQE